MASCTRTSFLLTRAVIVECLEYSVDLVLKYHSSSAYAGGTYHHLYKYDAYRLHEEIKPKHGVVLRSNANSNEGAVMI